MKSVTIAPVALTSKSNSSLRDQTKRRWFSRIVSPHCCRCAANPEGTERNDQDRAFWVVRDGHSPTMPVRLVTGQPRCRHHQMRKSSGSRMRDTNVSEIGPYIISEALLAV